MGEEKRDSAAYRSEKAQLILELRRAGITDAAILEAMEKTPRELFVPETFRRHAYDNSALPIAEGQTISQPQIVGLMTQALNLNKRCKVLEIGTGSGYQAVILSHLCRRVYTVERRRGLLKPAEAIFRRLDRHNIVTRFGDGMQGWPEQAPFDRIMVTAAAGEIPRALTDQLAVGGIMVVPVDEPGDLDPLGAQDLLRLVKRPDGSLERESLCPVRFVPLLAGTEAPC